ncbi:unnamed protein product [Leptosia nina]|uniref:C2H2-type domain-containing protein n=1 Tax=Leptosia nina TaxID=320188 RepID=A0AAV1K3G5_9NEOP
MFSCPLCCCNTFSSKELLLDHLTSLTNNLSCPICKAGISSIDDLLLHLKSSCAHPVILVDESHNQAEQQLGYELEASDDEDGAKPNPEQITEYNSLYTELVSENVQELKLVKECNNRYVLIGNNESVINGGATLVSKQNEDGTVSFSIEESENTDCPDEQQADEYANTAVDSESQATGDPEQNFEVYSCNTCDMTFTSVLEHIQNYHNDQDVVVEEPIDSVADNQTVSDDVIDDKQIARRMITDTGDIVEELVQDIEQAEQVPSADIKTKQEKTKRRYVKQDKKESVTEITEPYHKVMLKTIVAPNGTIMKAYCCMFCKSLVSSLAEFKDQPCVRNNPSKYICHVCSVTYDNAKSLCAHMKAHKEKQDPTLKIVTSKFECEVCNTKFRTSKSLKLHKRMHDPIKPRPIQPPVDTSEKNPTKDKFLCGVCKKLIPLDYLKIHQKSHQNADDFTCDLCNKKFPTKEYMEMHMKVHNMYKAVPGKQESGSLPYKCVYCSREFARPHEKVKHERIHTGEKPHSCEICGKSFRVAYCLTLHMRTHTGARPYECPHCPKKFKAHSVYYHHILTHSEVRAYKCPFCPKAFKTSVQLAGHRNSHTKPFLCQQCNRPFASLYAVRVHMEVHTRQNNLKFKCTECGASYARAFALKDHVKQAHGHLGDVQIDNIVTVEHKEVESLWEPNLMSESVEVKSQDADIPEINSPELIA